MNHRNKPAPPVIRNRAYRRAFQRLDEALMENTTVSNAERIALMRRVAFADVDALLKSGRIKVPQ